MTHPFVEELRIWADLYHPNIHPFFGYTIKDNCPSFISEWMDNRTASRYVKANSLSSADILRLATGIARGLEHIHGSGVVHSDLKAANILISPRKTPLISDFGISRVPGGTLTGGKSDSGTLQGSLRWMAPELFDFEGEVTHSRASDVWAYGMTILELISKNVPYENIHIEPVVMFAIIQGKLPSQEDHSLNPEMTLLLEVCKWCWAFDPNHRGTIGAITRKLDPLTPPVQTVEKCRISSEPVRVPRYRKVPSASISLQLRQKRVNRLLATSRYILLDLSRHSFTPLTAAGNWQLDAWKVFDSDYLKGPATRPPLTEIFIICNGFGRFGSTWLISIKSSYSISVIELLSTVYTSMHTPITQLE